MYKKSSCTVRKVVEKHSPVNNEVWRRMRLNLRETLLFVQLEFSHLEVKKHKAHIDFLELFHLESVMVQQAAVYTINDMPTNTPNICNVHASTPTAPDVMTNNLLFRHNTLNHKRKTTNARPQEERKRQTRTRTD